MLQGVARYRPPPGRLVLPDVCCDATFVGGRLFFNGALTHAREASHVGQDVLLMRIGVPATRSILGAPLAELTDCVVPLDEINRPLARDFLRRIEMGSLDGCFDSWYDAAADSRFVTAARLLVRGCSVGDTAKRVALSERQLERLLQERVGVAPRTFKRIVRFRRAVIAASRGMPLAEAALAHGYADQAHMTREVVALTGRPPRALLPGLVHVGSVQDVARWRGVGCE